MRALAIDVDHYHGLQPEVRERFDEWMQSNGIDKGLIFSMCLGEGFVVIGRYLRDATGSRYIANREAPREEWVAASEYVEIPVRSMPPVEVFV